jgi:transposase
MPKAHREYAEWSPERFISWAAGIGPATKQAVETILVTKSHPEQGFKSCMGILSLGKRYGNERLEAACQRAIAIKGLNYKSIKATLENNLDRKPLTEQQQLPLVTHQNIRGTTYYH